MSVDHPAIIVAVNRSENPIGEGAPSKHRRSPSAPGAPPAGPPSEGRSYLTPPIDIHESPEGLVLEADLPGVSESGVTVQLEDNVLSLLARVDPVLPGGGRVLHEEYQVSDFYRSFILSDEVERSRITAELKNGVLRLTMPRAERSKTRRIEVKS